MKNDLLDPLAVHHDHGARQLCPGSWLTANPVALVQAYLDLHRLGAVRHLSLISAPGAVTRVIFEGARAVAERPVPARAA